MPKRKTHKRQAPARRRRMGASGNNRMMNMLAAIGGAVVANIVQKAVPDDIAGMDMTKYKGAIPVAIGFFLPNFVKAPWAQYAGLGMVAGGGATLLKDSGIIGAMMDGEAPMIAAYEKQQYLNSSDSAPMVGGRRKPTYAG